MSEFVTKKNKKLIFVFIDYSTLAMAVACGSSHLLAVEEVGSAVWTTGKGSRGQLGRGREASELGRRWAAAGSLFFGAAAPIVMVAAGEEHTAAVASDGALLTFGDGTFGQLGLGDNLPRFSPTRLDRNVFGQSPVVMAACGWGHTLVLTTRGDVWSAGWGSSGQLGLGKNSKTLTFRQVGMARFGGAPVAMVAAGMLHSVGVTAEGELWTWGCGGSGRLGHGDLQDRDVPTLVGLESRVSMVSAGTAHTVVVSINGGMWSVGSGSYGQLGLGDTEDRLLPAAIELDARVKMVACGGSHTLAVTERGLWSWGRGDDGRLGLSDTTNRLVPTLVNAEHFEGAQVVAAAGGQVTSAAVTDCGALFTWGKGRDNQHSPCGLGLGDLDNRHAPTRVSPQDLGGARIGRCRQHSLPEPSALALAMGTHPRLGEHTAHIKAMPPELVQRVVAACRWRAQPEFESGVELSEGVMRLLGGHEER